MQMDQIKSYKDAEAFFNTCRNVDKGKPLPAGWRLYREGSGSRPVYWIDIGWRKRYRLCDIYPDNTVKFQLTPEEFYDYSNSIVMVLYKILPIVAERKRQGVYKVGAEGYVSNSWGNYTVLDKATACEYFQGLTFDLETRQITNPQPDLVDTADPDIRKAWRKDLTRFKRGLKARAKVGALNGYIDTFTNTKEYQTSRWDFYSKKFSAEDGTDMSDAENSNAQQYVLECMRTEQYPADLLRAFVFWAIKHNIYAHSQLDNQSVLKYVDKMFNKHSLDYRKAYGVFGDKKLDTCVR